MSRPVRVLQISSGFAIEGPLGGIERFTVDLARALPQEQVIPLVCGMWSYGTSSERTWLDALQNRRIESFMAAPWDEKSPYRSFLKSWKATEERFAGRQVDIIHSHCQFGDMLALLLKRKLGARAVIRTVHNEREWPKRPERRVLFTNGVAPLWFDAEVGVSKAVVSNLNRRPLARLLGKQAHLCYNSLDLSRFTHTSNRAELQQMRRTLGIPEGALVIGSVGRLETQKGYRYLLEAMEIVLRQLPRTHLVIAGDGSLREALHRQATASGAAQHVHLVGPLQNIETFYALIDLFVSSSLWEGLPTVLLESICANIPIVATQVAGTVELIEDGVSGRLVAPGDPVALAEAIVASFLDDASRHEMARRALRIIERFDIRKAASFHTDLYGSLLS